MRVIVKVEKGQTFVYYDLGALIATSFRPKRNELSTRAGLPSWVKQHLSALGQEVKKAVGNPKEEVTLIWEQGQGYISTVGEGFTSQALLTKRQENTLVRKAKTLLRKVKSNGLL
jgi:hypothetical protein